MTSTTALQVREIVFASDFSRHSDHAFRAALALAQHFGARLRLLHVVHHAHEERAARERLDSFVQQRAAGADAVTAVAVGVPAAEIVKYAASLKADLIVMGTHGRTGLAHALMGSVAEKVVRHSPCQVLTIGAQAPVPEPAPERPERQAAPEAPAERCLVCGQVSEDLVCSSCKARIRAEALYRKFQDEKGERPGPAA